MRRVLLILLVLGLCAGVGFWIAWDAVTNAVRQRVEQLLTRALDRPTRIQALSVSLAPVRVHVGGVVLGATPAVLASIDSLDARLWPVDSLLEGRPVVSIQVQSAMFDVARLPPGKAPSPETGRGGGMRLPSFRVREIELSDARLQFPLVDANAALVVAHVAGTGESRSGSQRLTASLEATAADLERAGEHLRVAHAQVDGGVDSHGVFVTSGVVTGEGIGVTVRAAAAPYRYTLAAQLDLAPLARFIHQRGAGAVNIDGTLSGNLLNPGLEAQLVAGEIRLADQLLGDLRARVNRDREVLQVTDLDAAGPFGHLGGIAELTFEQHIPVQGDLRLEAVDVDTVLAALGQHLEFRDRVNATGSLTATLDPLHLAFQATGEAVSTRDAASQSVASLAVSGDIDQHGPDLQIEVTQPEHNRVVGHLAVKDAQLDAQIGAQVADLAALATVVPAAVGRLTLTGRAEGNVTLSGPASRPTVAADVTATDVTVMGTSAGRVAGAVIIEGARLSTRGVKIETGAGGAEVSGAVALDSTGANDWQLDIHDLDTDLLVGAVRGVAAAGIPVSGGKVNGTLRGRGVWERAELQGDLTASSFYLFQEPVDRVEIKARTQLPNWTLAATVVHAGTETVTVDGAGTGTASVRVSLDSTPVQLANLRGASRSRLRGTVVVHGRLTGKPLAADGSVQINVSDLSVRDRQLGDIVLQANGNQGVWHAVASAFEKALDADATLRMESAFPYSLAVRAQELQLARLLAADPALEVAVSADINLSGSLKTWATPNGTLRITRFETRRDQYAVAAAEPIRLDVEEGHFRIRSLVLAAAGSRLTASGEVATSGQCDIQAQGEGDLVLLELIGRPFNSARGRFTVSAHVRRSPGAEWDLSGQGRLRDATLDLGLPIALTDTNGNFTLGGSRIHIDNLDGKSGGGQIHVDGDVDLSAGPALAWKVQDVVFSTEQGLEARLAGSGTVQGTWKLLTVNGDVDVLNALYDKNIELVDLLPSFRAQIQPAPRTQPATTIVQLNLRLRAPSGLYVDNNLAKAELSATLRLAGTAEKPALTGTVEFLTGEVTFRSRVFTVTAGTIDFRDPARINPVLNITAESEIHTTEADYTVTVSVTGTAESPRVQFSADDPNLSQNDIVSLITFGKTMAQLQREGGGVSAADALALLPTGAATERVGKMIGIDRFEVEAIQSRNSGSIEPRVTIGKDLTDEFRASVSSSFGVESQRLVQLEYRMTHRFSLLGTWEGQTESQAGAFGGDLKFRYEFRTLPFSLLPGRPTSPPGADAQ